MTRRKIEYWVIPPEADAEFVAHMEQVLDIYARPYDPAHPVVCMDEQPVQLIKETHRVLLHAEARELAEHRRERTEFDDAPMPGRAPHRRP